MGAVALVARRRIARHWRALVAAGVLLGLGFGLSLASVAAARRTSSAYGRILTAADAPDAAVALTGSPAQAAQGLQAIDGVTHQRVYAGFLGTADGVEPSVTTALIAPVRDGFPIERPRRLAGRLPRPDAPDEIFVNAGAAARGKLRLGQSLHFRFLTPGSSAVATADVRVVGIGTLPIEPVADETMVLGVMVFTRAFYEAHTDLVAYVTTNVYLAPGVDARRDLAPAVGALGFGLQSARVQEQHAVNEALRPILSVLVVLAVIAFGATAVAAAQTVQRNRDRWLADSAISRTLGMTRGQVRLAELATSGVIAALAVLTALATMVLTSPLSPIGPLHDLDPAQGVRFDLVVGAVGALAIAVTVTLLTLAFSTVRHWRHRAAPEASPWLATLATSPTAIAGLTLALRTADASPQARLRRRGRGWRAVVATTVAAAVVALCAVFLASAADLVDTPTRYGFGADLVVLNAYGDQSDRALQAAFGADRDDVVAATGYTSAPLLVRGRAVPGLASTPVKGVLGPTLLRGRLPRAQDEIVLGTDSLDTVGAEVGDVVPVRIAASPGPGEQTGPSLPMKVVGAATFPAVSQIGTDMPRLGVGALVTRDGFLRMSGATTNGPEFTVVRLAPGISRRAVITGTPDLQENAQSATVWFSDAKPAELLQLDAAMPYLRGALVVGFVVLLAVVIHALWTLVRANRHDLAVLRAIGCTRRQLDAVTGWQVAPFALAGTLLGIPIGIMAGRIAFRRFAQSFAVVDDASSPAVVVLALVVAVLVAAAIADVVAVGESRRTRTAATLREG